VDEAVQAAATAFPAWRDTPAAERVRVLFRYRELVERNFDRLCQLKSREKARLGWNCAAVFFAASKTSNMPVASPAC
jgi:malonate-semialdehyde dehydrogenase (acetylating)/methylmalonate-semialdehyde dehydrogenase